MQQLKGLKHKTKPHTASCVEFNHLAALHFLSKEERRKNFQDRQHLEKNKRKINQEKGM